MSRTVRRKRTSGAKRDIEAELMAVSRERDHLRTQLAAEQSENNELRAAMTTPDAAELRADLERRAAQTPGTEVVHGYNGPMLVHR